MRRLLVGVQHGSALQQQRLLVTGRISSTGGAKIRGDSSRTSSGPIWPAPSAARPGRASSPAAAEEAGFHQAAPGPAAASLVELDAGVAGAAAALADWGLDPEAMGREARCSLVVQMFHTLDLLRLCDVEPATLEALAAAVEAGMPDNPYHNSAHAFNVALTAWRLLRCGGLRQALEPLHQLALLLAALCHDLQHPGTNNAFQVASCSALAAMAAEVSVLELHHCRCAHAALATSCVLGGLSASDQRAVRKTITNAILSTDMALHSDLLARAAARVASGCLLASKAADDRQLLVRAPPCPGRERTNPAGSPAKMTLRHDPRLWQVSLLLHCADMHTALLEPAADARWTRRVFAECEAQAEKERTLQLPISVMLASTDEQIASMEVRRVCSARPAACRRLPPSRTRPAAGARIPAAAQVGFLHYIVRPLYALLADLEPQSADLLERVDASIVRWSAAMPGGAQQAQQGPCDDDDSHSDEWQTMLAGSRLEHDASPSVNDFASLLLRGLNEQPSRGGNRTTRGASLDLRRRPSLEMRPSLDVPLLREPRFPRREPAGATSGFPNEPLRRISSSGAGFVC